MNDKEFDALRKKLQCYITRWVKPLGLGWWRLHFIYNREPEEDDFHGSKGETAGRCIANWQYKEATITFNMSTCAAMKELDMERMFVHELMHVFLNEARQRDIVTDREESVATQLASAFMWHRDAVLAEGKKLVKAKVKA